MIVQFWQKKGAKNRAVFYQGVRQIDASDWKYSTQQLGIA